MERASFVAAPDGRYLDADAAALELFGVDREAFLAAAIGDFSGPYRDMSRRIWRQMAASGDAFATGQATIFRRDGTTIRVRYERVAQRPDGTFEIQLVSLGAGDGPPVVDDLAVVLRQWQRAERDQGRDGATVASLRELYRFGVQARLERHRRRPSEPIAPSP